MRDIPYSIIAVIGLLLASGCVRRTISSRPGWKDPASGKLMGITKAHEKTEGSKIIWFWDPEFREAKNAYQQTEPDEGSTR